MTCLARILPPLCLLALALAGPARAADGVTLGDHARRVAAPASASATPVPARPPVSTTASARDGSNGCQSGKIVGTGAGFCMIN
jgi:hypothetical protein